MKAKKMTCPPSVDKDKITRRRKVTETIASVGMLLIAVGMFLPLLNLTDISHLNLFKWVFAGGTLLFWGARCVNVAGPDESLRIRRLRRMEFWAGACFGVAAFFWFYNESRYGGVATTGPLTILKDTILFALAGAVLQLISAWMIYFRQKKEAKGAARSENASDKS